MRAQRSVELIQRHARLNRDGALGDIDVANAATARAHVQHDGVVHTLTSQTCSTAPGQHGNATRAAIAHNVNGGLGPIQNDHANGLHLIHAGVGGVQHAVMFFKSHLAHIHHAQIMGRAFTQLSKRGEHGQMNRQGGN